MPALFEKVLCFFCEEEFDPDFYDPPFSFDDDDNDNMSTELPQEKTTEWFLKHLIEKHKFPKNFTKFQTNEIIHFKAKIMKVYLFCIKDHKFV